MCANRNSSFLSLLGVRLKTIRAIGRAIPSTDRRRPLKGRRLGGGGKRADVYGIRFSERDGHRQRLLLKRAARREVGTCLVHGGYDL